MPQNPAPNKWKKKKKANTSSRKSSKAESSPSNLKLTEQPCPKCRKGTLLKGKTAYGCSRWKENCTFRLPFAFAGKTIPEKQLFRLLAKGSTVQLKGFLIDGEKQTGKLQLNKRL